MADFGNCSGNFYTLTNDNICNGFTICGDDGIQATAAGLNSVIRYLQDMIPAPVPPPAPTLIVSGDLALDVSGNGIAPTPFVIDLDYDALASALCSNPIFQSCVASIAGGGGGNVAPMGPASFTETGTEFTAINVNEGTFIGSAPITLNVSGLPAGVTFTDNGNGTFNLSGTWPNGGTYSYSVTATNPYGSVTVPGQLVSLPVASALSATMTFAPTVANPGGADPNAGAELELLDVIWQATGGVPDGLNKALYLVVSGIAGGTGPYTVDFSGVQWSMTPDNLTLVGAEVFWGLNQNVVPLTGTGNQSIAPISAGVSGTAPAAAVVTGLTSADFASFAPRLNVPTLPPLANTPILFAHTYASGTVTVTDSASNTLVLTVPAYFDDWSLVNGSGGGV